MSECIACGEQTLLPMCPDCSDIAVQDVEGSSFISGMIAWRKRGCPVDMSDPWDMVGS